MSERKVSGNITFSYEQTIQWYDTKSLATVAISTSVLKRDNVYKFIGEARVCSLPFLNEFFRTTLLVDWSCLENLNVGMYGKKNYKNVAILF